MCVCVAIVQREGSTCDPIALPEPAVANLFRPMSHNIGDAGYVGGRAWLPVPV